MTDPSVHRDLGRIDATLDAQRSQLKELARTQKEMSEQVQAIHDVLTQVGGGWKTLLFVGTISAFFTGVMLKIASFFGSES